MSTRQPRHKQDRIEMRRALAALAIEGDAHAFECLYSMTHPTFIRVAFRLCGDPEAARDIVQEAAIVMARKIRRLKNPSAFIAWGCKIIRYRTQDYFRKKQRYGIALSLDEDVLSATDSFDYEASISLRQSLDRLNPDDRRLMLMFYVDGFTGAELAGALGVPVGTIKSRLFKIRQNLKLIYTKEGDHNE